MEDIELNINKNNDDQDIIEYSSDQCNNNESHPLSCKLSGQSKFKFKAFIEKVKKRYFVKCLSR